MQYLLAYFIMHQQHNEKLVDEQGMLDNFSGEAITIILIARLLQRESVCGPQGLKVLPDNRGEPQTDFFCGPSGLRNARSDSCYDLTKFFCSSYEPALIKSEEKIDCTLR
jgi:hypothetical protein